MVHNCPFLPEVGRQIAENPFETRTPTCTPPWKTYATLGRRGLATLVITADGPATREFFFELTR